MIYISHRGNLFGPSSADENHPDYIKSSLDLNYECEIDIRFMNDKWYLGHDEPQYQIPLDFLFLKGLWIHCKNIDAMSKLLIYRNLNFFWHQEDDYTLTSQGYIWCYPGKNVSVSNKSICVMPELTGNKFLNFEGVCSDFIGNLRDKSSII